MTFSVLKTRILKGKSFGDGIKKSQTVLMKFKTQDFIETSNSGITELTVSGPCELL
jgi:hypothetical protein